MSETHGTFEHGADFGIWGRGPGVTQAFCEAAKAMFALVTDLAAVKPQVTVYFDFEESDVEMALVRWLNLLLFHAADQGIVLARFTLAREGDRWNGSASGEPWREGLERGTDVKGATLTMLSVVREGETWDARCVVDV
ncbi:MAG: archease [Betaproteobacteria bacterium]|nr:archease [Betaproteobacteria bacterium]PWB60194.1 MAG: archease [Betaproteobacteria bacterium]